MAPIPPNSEDELHVGLAVPNSTAKQIHQWARQQNWPEGTELEHPNDYHVTLLYTPEGHNDHQNAWWMRHMDQAPAKVTGLKHFPAQDGSYAHVLTLDSPEISQRAEEMQGRAKSQGLSVTDYEDGFKPHITLGYGPSSDFTGDSVPNWEFDVGPSSVSPLRATTAASKLASPWIPEPSDPWALWEGEPSPSPTGVPQYMYHVAFPRHRQSIQDNGLGTHWGNWSGERQQEEQEMNYSFPEGWDESDMDNEMHLKNKVWLHPTLEGAQRMNGYGDGGWGGNNDIWRVNVAGLPLQYEADDWEGHTTPYAIQPDRLALLHPGQHRGSAAPQPPNYREGTEEKRCGTCKMFWKGQCWGYGNKEVRGGAVCDSWSPETKRSAYNPDETQILDHLSLTNVAANLHYKFEEGGLDAAGATEYAKKMLALIGYPQDDITVQAALQAWQQSYPGDKVLQSGSEMTQIEAPPTVPTESYGYGTKSSGADPWEGIPFDEHLAKTSGETLPQEKRRWDQLNTLYPPQSIVAHQFPDNYTIQQHHTDPDVNRVGEFMQNCWRQPQHLDEAHENGWSYAALHDEHGMPRVAWFEHTNPWINKQYAQPQIKSPLGMRNGELWQFPHSQYTPYLREYADAKGYDFREPRAPSEPVSLDAIPGLGATIGEPRAASTAPKKFGSTSRGLSYSFSRTAAFGWREVEPVSGPNVGIRGDYGPPGTPFSPSEHLAHHVHGRDTGHFGTGLYFVSTPEAAGILDRAHTRGVDLTGYNLYRPRTNAEGYKLHDDLAKLNILANQGVYAYDRPSWGNSTTPVSIDSLYGVPGWHTPEGQQAMKDAIDATHADVQAGWNQDRTRWNADTASTRYMRAMGYEGIDTRHLNQDADTLSGLDNTTYGSVLYRPNDDSRNSSLRYTDEDGFGVRQSSRPVAGAGGGPTAFGWGPQQSSLRRHDKASQGQTSSGESQSKLRTRSYGVDGPVEQAGDFTQEVLSPWKSKGLAVLHEEYPDQLHLHTIELPPEQRRQGYGQRFMQHVKTYSDAYGKPLVIDPVTNPGFFNKFDWLTPNHQQTRYEYQPEPGHFATTQCLNCKTPLEDGRCPNCSTIPSEVNNPDDHIPEFGQTPPDKNRGVQISNDWVFTN